MRSLVRPLSVLFGLVLVLSAGSADAKKPEDVFGGRVMTSDKPYPRTSRSAAAYITQVKKQSKDRFQEDKENKRWTIYYAAFFKKPVNDLEIKVTVYDITTGERRFVMSWEEFLTERGQRIVVGRAELKREEGKLDANAKVMMVMESGGKVIATATFYAVGEAKKRSGKADFSEEETKEQNEE